ncbi:MAG: BatD family protein [Bacteroidales bacterium]|nr:BatD family protein [Candidatus Cacconaster merdequi]
MKRVFTLIALAIAFTCAAQGTLTIEAPSVVEADETFRLVFTADGRMSDFNWPGTNDFDVVWGPQQGSMSSTSIINGKRTSTHQETVTYLLRPKAEGNFTISGATAKIDKTECASTPFTIEVVASKSASVTSQSQGQTQSQMQSQSQSDARTTGTVSGDNIFLRLTVSKTSAVKGEPITATLKIYTREDIAGFEDIKFPVFNGFWSKETVTVQNLEFKRENVSGEIFNSALLRQYMLIPQQSGAIVIDPAEMVCQIRVRTNGGMGRSIFDDFFDSYQTIRKRIYSDKITINVKELPSGAPSSFGGGVGSFKISSALSKSEIKSNEAASLTVTVSGRGNISMIEAPKVNFPSDFEVYDIKSSENVSSDGTSGTKTFEYPFIPRSHGSFTIDPVEFTYYDNSKGRYETLSTDAIEIEISKGEEVDGGGIVTPGINRQGVRNLAEDIRYIALGDGNLAPKGRFFALSPLFFILIALIALLFFVANRLLIFSEKRKSDIAGTKNRKANKMARSRLNAAESYMKQNLGTAYYEELHKALLGYVSDKLSIPAAELSKESIFESLSGNGVKADTVNSLTALIDKCEFARYSPESAQIQMENEYNEAVRVISQIESEVKHIRNLKKGTKATVAALIMLLSANIFAQDASSLWTGAGDAFAQSEWQNSLDLYKSIEAQGLESADLYYNIGNAYYKLGDIPHSILYFERSLKLDPSHDDARNNLAIVSQMTLDKIEIVPEFVLATWLRELRESMSADGWAYMTIILVMAVAALMLVFLRSSSMKARKLSFIAACIVMFFTIVTFIFSASGRRAVSKVESAIVTSPVSSVKSSPTDGGNAIFVLHEGTKVKLLDEVGEWTKIELGDGRQGWLQKSTIEEI